MRETGGTSINPTAARYIKLGEGGKWERECIKEQHTLRIGFEEVPHSLCSEGKWIEVAALLRAKGYSASVASGFSNQIRVFYEAGEDILWITFYAARLWWCLSQPRVTVLSDGSKTRPAIGGWRSCDVQGRLLDITRLSGRLVMLQRFQGTICSVPDERLEYLRRKINSEVEPEVQAASSARSSLEEAVKTVVGKLHWRDFELLVDLIFRQAGWRRIGELGGTQKTLDLVLVSPITAERYGVQVKAQADLAAFKDYERQVESMEGFARFYFAVHSPSADLEQAEAAGKVELLRPAEVAEWSVRYGLVDWIIDKAG
jgi:hypothetical protein